MELRIVDRASDNDRAGAQKTFSSPIADSAGSSAQGQRRVRSGDGRRAGRLHAATRSRSSAGLPGRDLKQLLAETRADPDETGAGPLRLRVRAHGTANLSCCRAARRLAPYQSHRSPHRRGLCSPLERRGRYPLLRRPDHRSGPGQSQHPQQGVTLRSLRPPKPGGWRAVEWHYTPKHGSWLNLAEWNSASYRPNVSTAASLTNKPSSRKSPPGRRTAIPITPRPIGTSQPQTLASNSNTSTRQTDKATSALCL